VKLTANVQGKCNVTDVNQYITEFGDVNEMQVVGPNANTQRLTHRDIQGIDIKRYRAMP
jgi:hypothetical protein